MINRLFELMSFEHFVIVADWVHWGTFV